MLFWFLIAFGTLTYIMSVPIIGMRLAQKYLQVWRQGNRSAVSFLLFPNATVENRVGNDDYPFMETTTPDVINLEPGSSEERSYLVVTAWLWLPSLTVSLIFAMFVAAAWIIYEFFHVLFRMARSIISGAVWFCESVAMRGSQKRNGNHG